MYYLLSLITFIFYYCGINIYKTLQIKLNKYKQIFEYKVIYEEYDFNYLDPLYFGLLLLPDYIQNIIMFIIILYVIKNLFDFYFIQKKSKQIIIIETYKTFFGIFLIINTIYNYNYNNYNDYIITSIINIFSLYLLFNNYQVKSCNSFTNS